MDVNDSGKKYRKRTWEEIEVNHSPRGLTLGPLHLPRQPTDRGESSQMPLQQIQRQKGESGNNNLLGNTEHCDPHLRLGNCSTNTIMTPMSVPQIVSFTDYGHMGKRSILGERNSGPFILYLAPIPKAKLTYLEFKNRYEVPLLTYTLAEYTSKACAVENDLVFTFNTFQRLRLSQISVWDLVKFLTNATPIFGSPCKLVRDSNTDIVYCEPSMMGNFPKTRAAAVVLSSREIKGWQLCRVRVIFAFPEGIRNIIPVSIPHSCDIPLRLAFVEWYSIVNSYKQPFTGTQFYEISPSVGFDMQPHCEVISLTDIRGSIPLSQKENGHNRCNTYLAHGQSIEAVIQRKCYFNLAGRTYQ